MSNDSDLSLILQAVALMVVGVVLLVVLLKGCEVERRSGDLRECIQETKSAGECMKYLGEKP